MRILYIAGSGRSGSTIISRLLGQADNCIAIGELKHIWERNFTEDQLCGCGRSFLACDFWQAVIDEAFGGFDKLDVPAIHRLRLSVDRVRHLPQMLSPVQTSQYRQNMREYGAILAALYRAIANVSGRDVIVDSSKEVSTLYFLNQFPEMTTHTLHLVRDSRGVAYSWMKRMLRPEITRQETYMRVMPPQVTARRWLYWNGLIEAGFRRRPERYRFLRYEDFVAEPERNLGEVLAHLAGQEDNLEFIDGNKVRLSVEDHTVSGNPNRFNRGEIEIRLDDAWRQGLKASDRRWMTLLTWPLLLRYGYFETRATPDTSPMVTARANQ